MPVKRIVSGLAVVALIAAAVMFIPQSGGHPAESVAASPRVQTSTTTATQTVEVTTSTETVAASQSSDQISLSPSGPNSCEIFAGGNDASITFTSRSYAMRPLCNNWEQTSAESGTTWVNVAQPVYGEQLKTICVLHAAAGEAPATITVQDTGIASIGSDACQQFIADGWLEPGS